MEPPPPAAPAPRSGLSLLPCPRVLCSSGKDGAARKHHPFPSPSIKSITGERTAWSRDFLLHFQIQDRTEHQSSKTPYSFPDPCFLSISSALAPPHLRHKHLAPAGKRRRSIPAETDAQKWNDILHFSADQRKFPQHLS